jgi:predicted nucleic acid-binding Zn ribbon protein
MVPPFPIAYAFHCHACGDPFRMKHIDDDPTSSTGCCCVCGSPRWHIYARFSDGHVELLE